MIVAADLLFALTGLGTAFAAGSVFTGADRLVGFLILIVASLFLAAPYIIPAVLS